MKNKYQVKTNFIVVITLLFFFNTKIFACYCEYPSVCEAYSKAKKVFVGKLEKVVKDEKASYYTIDAYFSVEKTYKGKTEDAEIIKFKLGDCSDLKLIVGEKYFVYAENSNINSYCNRTNLLSGAKLDLEFIGKISQTKPVFTIRGYISQYNQLPQKEITPKKDTKNFKITIKNGKKFYKVVVDKYGGFNFILKKEGVYHVVIQLPFLAEIEADNDSARNHESVKITSTKTKTRIEYDAVFKANECDIKKFSFTPLPK